MTTEGLLSNPALLLGAYIIIRVADQVIIDFTDRLLGRRDRYLTKDHCDLLRIEHLHKLDLMHQEQQAMKRDLKVIRKVLAEILDHSGIKISGSNFVDIVPPPM